MVAPKSAAGHVWTWKIWEKMVMDTSSPIIIPGNQITVSLRKSGTIANTTQWVTSLERNPFLFQHFPIIATAQNRPKPPKWGFFDHPQKIPTWTSQRLCFPALLAAHPVDSRHIFRCLEVGQRSQRSSGFCASKRGFFRAGVRSPLESTWVFY